MESISKLSAQNCSYPTPLTKSWFSFMRVEGYPTRYKDQFSPAHVDVLTAGLILAFVIIAICFYIILPGFSKTRRWSLFIYVTVSLFIGGVVMVGNYGHQWEVGKAEIVSQYKPGSAEELHAHLGLHIALRGINVTLKGVHNPHIDYNEHFSWEWGQGRFGFGKYAGRFSQDFRTAVLKGLPYPILQVAEYFTFDGEGIRFGRHYRLAGWYSHIMMWSAFPLWIIANILFASAIQSGATCLVLTGICQLIANLIWAFLRNPIELSIPFESPNEDDNYEVVLNTYFGPDYYLVLFNGILCVVLGVTIWLLAEIIPDEMCQWFGIDPLVSYDEYLTSQEDTKDKGKLKSAMRDPEKGEHQPLFTQSQVSSGGPTYGTSTGEADISDEHTTVLKRRKTSKGLRTGVKALALKPKVTPRSPNVRFENPPSTIIFEEQETTTPLLPPDGKELDESEAFGDYANLPPASPATVRRRREEE